MAQENPSVTFRSKDARLQLHLKGERKGFKGEEPFVIPAEIAEFQDCMYVTSDPEVIEIIRNTDAFKQHRVIEITDEDRKNVSMSPPTQQTIRGAVSSKDFSKELGAETNFRKKMRLEEGITQCEICEKIFKNDKQGRRLKMHKVSHRDSVTKPKQNGIKPTMEEKTEEPTQKPAEKKEDAPY